jgi:hypothetical protein
MEAQKFVDLVLNKTGVVMENEEKVVRAVDGTSTNNGLVGGVGRDAEPEVILAKYDYLHGYMTKDGLKVKNGCFYDSKTLQPAKNPVVFLVSVNGEIVEQKETEVAPVTVEIAKKQARAKKLKKTNKKE